MHLKRAKQVTLSRSKGGTVALVIILIIACAFTALPLVYSIIQSLKPVGEIFMYPPRFYVINPSLENFSQIYSLIGSLDVPFTRYLFNSLFVTVAGTAIYLIIASLAGYSLAKGKFKGKSIISTIIVLALLFRPEVTAIPQYLIVSSLGMTDTYLSQILPPLAGTMGVFLIRQFVISGVPDSVLEAARMDGAGELKIFTRIVFPSIKPAVMTVLIFTFQSVWNGAGTRQYIFSEGLKDLPTALSTISGGGLARAGATAAVSVILMLPPILVFLISQRSVMETMTHSGLK